MSTLNFFPVDDRDRFVEQTSIKSSFAKIKSYNGKVIFNSLLIEPYTKR